MQATQVSRRASENPILGDGQSDNQKHTIIFTVTSTSSLSCQPPQGMPQDQELPRRVRGLFSSGAESV